MNECEFFYLTERDRQRALRWAELASTMSKLADDGGDEALIERLGGWTDPRTDLITDTWA